MTILDETFCLYCQEEYLTPEELQVHVLECHPRTIAEHSILKERKKREAS